MLGAGQFAVGAVATAAVLADSSHRLRDALVVLIVAVLFGGLMWARVWRRYGDAAVDGAHTAPLDAPLEAPGRTVGRTVLVQVLPLAIVFAFLLEVDRHAGAILAGIALSGAADIAALSVRLARRERGSRTALLREPRYRFAGRREGRWQMGKGALDPRDFYTRSRGEGR